MSIQIDHQADARRFATVVDGIEAHLDYLLRDGVMIIAHTGVPPEIGGRGIAGALVQAAFDHAREAGLKVDPRCSYSDAWIQRHPDYQDLRA
jgi:predicted GNAT family acetyltransferase